MLGIFSTIFYDGIRPTDIALAAADVLIVYYIIYRILLIIKGTRALQALLGLVFIMLGYGVCKALGLVAVSWLFDQFFGSLLLVMVIIFQSDIRRALSRIGRNPFSTMVTSAEEARIIDGMVKAAAKFSERRTGALIVIEREADLADYIESGIRINGEVTAELLLTLFDTHTPLHDGAVIIQQGRLAAAAVLLPLSGNPTLARELGTRHRAAIGISEETDAVVVVVSEETGKISLCMKGRITRDLDQDTLRKVLLNLVGGSAAEGHRAAKDNRDRATTSSKPLNTKDDT